MGPMVSIARTAVRRAPPMAAALAAAFTFVLALAAGAAAEEVLDSMDDGLRVRSEVTNEGIIVYDFPELRHRPSLESGSAG